MIIYSPDILLYIKISVVFLNFLETSIPLLANHVQQLVFIGDTGFKFPVGHFETYGDATADLLVPMVWEKVLDLEYYGVQVIIEKLYHCLSCKNEFLKSFCLCVAYFRITMINLVEV